MSGRQRPGVRRYRGHGDFMRLRVLVLGAALLASGMSSASATMFIAEDRGGQIGHYLQTFASLRSSGENVVIDGNCLSACTLVLGLIPRNRICVTERARFGFHAAWMPDADGRPVTSALGTQALWNIYPGEVRRWINRHGGLSRKMIYMQGHDLAGIVHVCSHVPQQSERAETHVRATRSAHRALPRFARALNKTVRYQRTSSANDSR
jgi:hypothetical protein